MNRLLATTVATLLAAGLLAGCGQTGALYFDEAPPADQLPPSRKAAPVSVVPVPAEAPLVSPAAAPAGQPAAAKKIP